MDGLPSKLTSVAIGVAAFIGGYVSVFPSGCTDEGGVSSWERCTSLIGTPAFSLTDWGLDNQLDILIPLVVGVLAGGITWWLLGLRKAGRG